MERPQLRQRLWKTHAWRWFSRGLLVALVWIGVGSLKWRGGVDFGEESRLEILGSGRNDWSGLGGGRGVRLA